MSSSGRIRSPSLRSLRRTCWFRTPTGDDRRRGNRGRARAHRPTRRGLRADPRARRGRRPNVPARLQRAGAEPIAGKLHTVLDHLGDCRTRVRHRRGRRRARPVGAARQGPPPVRAAGGIVPGRRPPLRRHAGRGGRVPGARPARGLGAGRREEQPTRSALRSATRRTHSVAWRCTRIRCTARSGSPPSTTCTSSPAGSRRSS